MTEENAAPAETETEEKVEEVAIDDAVDEKKNEVDDYDRET